MDKTKRKLIHKFGEDIKDVILFGSRAKKNSSDTSDYDLLVVVGSDYDWEYKNKIFDALFDIEYQYDL
ncbi:MAG: nucleotidyltransferase domain-containing protein, partial [Bacteroidales bacterium]